MSWLGDVIRVGFELGPPIMRAVREPSAENNRRAFDALDAFRIREREKLDAKLARKHGR